MESYEISKYMLGDRISVACIKEEHLVFQSQVLVKSVTEREGRSGPPWETWSFSPRD